ncbi:ubiquitin-conjugating enzyme family protein [Streptomyces sp. NPDC002886]|uniref:ubiquitin-conjugating enzyme family protein n=1 Tax=Streptomyces sp. NPDC002886 TaxID=3364667 RepID=UPI003681FD7A
MSTTRSTTVKRATADWRQVETLLADEPIRGGHRDGDVFAGTVLLVPPPDSLYYGARLKVSVTLPADYPRSPPDLVSLTPVFHPNISNTGIISFPLLAEKWSPDVTLYQGLISLLALLDEPDVHDPLRPEAAEVYILDRDAYLRRVRQAASG